MAYTFAITCLEFPVNFDVRTLKKAYKRGGQGQRAGRHFPKTDSKTKQNTMARVAQTAKTRYIEKIKTNIKHNLAYFDCSPSNTSVSCQADGKRLCSKVAGEAFVSRSPQATHYFLVVGVDSASFDSVALDA